MKTNTRYFSTLLAAAIALALGSFNAVAADRKDEGGHHEQSSHHSAPAARSSSHVSAHQGGGGGGHHSAPNHFIAHNGGGGGGHQGAPFHYDASKHFIAHNGGGGAVHHDAFVHHAGVSGLHSSPLVGHGGSSHFSGVGHHFDSLGNAGHHAGYASIGHGSPRDFVTPDHHGGVSHSNAFAHSGNAFHNGGVSHSNAFAHSGNAFHNGGGSRYGSAYARGGNGYHNGGSAHWAGYAERHEHHSPYWYADNGWNYDWDYWRNYHQSCYYNDDDACVIFDTSGPPPYYAGGYYPQEEVAVEPQSAYPGTVYDAGTREAVQEALAQQGYYQGDIDGAIGPVTRDAIASYQQDHGLSTTGFINDALITSLGLR